MKSALLPLVLLLSSLSIAQTHDSWISVGPDGGDVRTLSADPANSSRLLLGTSAGQIYESKDSGHNWQRFVRIGKGNDYVIDHIVFDPKQSGIIYVAAWTLEHEGGAVFKSTDDGHTWDALPALDGKSVRALAMAPSDSKTLVAGALDGLFETHDGGEKWKRISPEKSAELKNIESLAIDPADPEVVYAGTWHLPWKTVDGGKSWHNIKNGVIDDSDVFSIIIDPAQPQVVYASACSGIYKSDNSGELFHKIQGIPFSARRTRVLKQDPSHPNVVYAGTTEGLFKTIDAGASWRRITSGEVIVNDVLVDSHDSNRVLLATDRSGVLASNDGGSSFETSNAGFAHRQVAALIADPEDSSALYAGLVNDKQYGGVFESRDRGTHWKQISTGLDGRDVFALRKTGPRLLAGTSNGVFELVSSETGRWRPLDRVANEHLVLVRKATRTRKAVYRKEVKSGLLRGRVADIEVHKSRLLVASSQGLFTSSNSGRSWQGGPLLGHTDFVLVRATPKLMAAAGRNYLLASVDDGDKWYEAKLPGVITSIRDFAITPDGGIWVASREGLYHSQDGGDTWERSLRLPVVDLASAFYDHESNRLFVTAMNSTEIFSSSDSGVTWQHEDSGWLLRSVLDDHGHLIASTAFDGVVISSENPTVASGSAAPAASAAQ
ncbi:MAG: transcriptional regulator [Acidobacteria bacterium]|nr:transcriptional regulator [Acidobacteriota bacterium]